MKYILTENFAKDIQIVKPVDHDTPWRKVTK